MLLMLTKALGFAIMTFSSAPAVDGCCPGCCECCSGGCCGGSCACCNGGCCCG